MNRTASLVYGGTVYAVFFATFLYAIAFVANLPVAPKTIDSGAPGPFLSALFVNTLLLADPHRRRDAPQPAGDLGGGAEVLR
jgi:hypothetical protein